VSILVEHALARAIVKEQTAQLSQIGPAGGGSGPPSPPGARSATRPPTVYQSANSGRVQARVIDLRSRASAVELPPFYDAGTVILLALAGLSVAVAGALGPATWAGLARTTTALHAEYLNNRGQPRSPASMYSRSSVPVYS
jgi:hypothetical protein